MRRRERAWIWTIAVLIMSQVVPVNAVRAQEEDWFSRLVFGVEVPTLSAQAIRLPSVIAEAEAAQEALARASDALARIESLESVRQVTTAATGAQSRAVNFLQASAGTVDRLASAADDVAADVGALSTFSSGAGEALSSARAALVQARDASPAPAYQAALTAADEAIVGADHSRVELQNAATSESMTIADEQAGLGTSRNDLARVTAAAAAPKTLDEPFLELVRRSRDAAIEGVRAREHATTSGTAISDAAAGVLAETDGFAVSLADALTAVEGARTKAADTGASTSDVDAAISQLTSINEAGVIHATALQDAVGLVRDETAASGNRNAEIGALDALATAETVVSNALDVMELVIPDPQVLLREALVDVQEAVASIDLIEIDTDETALLLERAKQEVQGALSDPPDIPEEDLDIYLASLRSLQDMIFGAGDSVTDIQLTQDELTPPAYELEDGLLAAVNVGMEASWTGVPENWKPTVEAVGARLVEIQLSAESSKVALFETGDGVDNAIEAGDNVAAQQEQAAAEEANESSGGTTPAKDGSKCSYDYQDGVGVYTGDEDPNECTGTGSPDIFHMRGESDTAWGRGGADQIHLSWGYDTAYGEDGPDQAWGGTENDELLGQYGNDFLRDSQDTALDGDRLYGGPGSDDGDILDGDAADAYYMGKGDDQDPKYDTLWVCAPPWGCKSQKDDIDKGD